MNPSSNRLSADLSQLLSAKPPCEASQVEDQLYAVRKALRQANVDATTVIVRARSLPLPPDWASVVRQAWDEATETHRRVAAMPGLDEATMAELSGLQAAVDLLRDLLAQEGVA